MLVFIELFAWNSISNEHIFEELFYVFDFAVDLFAHSFYRKKHLRKACPQEISSVIRNCILLFESKPKL